MTQSLATAQNPALDPKKSFQGLILTLQQFWAQQGAVILQPYDMEVGAGTFHPATTLRSLGKKPWKAAYVQPSRRPKDGRYGENPNRLQHYYQFQVILKPSPGNLQDLYLQSLAAIGVDAALHDIRFVEDDWESPTLGAIEAIEVQVIDVFDALHIHGEALKAIGEFAGDGGAFDARDLLEIGELRHLHAVAPAFPSKAPGAERRAFPVVLDEADVVQGGIDADGGERLQV